MRDTAFVRPVPAVLLAAVLRLLVTAGVALAAWLAVAVFTATAAHAENAQDSNGSGRSSTTAPPPSHTWPAPDKGAQPEDALGTEPAAGAEPPETEPVEGSEIPEGPEGPETPEPAETPETSEPPALPEDEPVSAEPDPAPPVQAASTEPEAADEPAPLQASMLRERPRESGQPQWAQFQSFDREVPQRTWHRAPAFTPEPERELRLPGLIDDHMHGLMPSVHDMVGDLDSGILTVPRLVPERFGVPDLEIAIPALPEMPGMPALPGMPEMDALPEMVLPGSGSGSSVQIAPPVDAGAGVESPFADAPPSEDGTAGAALGTYTVQPALHPMEHTASAGYPDSDAGSTADGGDDATRAGGGGGSTGGQPPTPPSVPTAPVPSVQHAQDQSGANRQPPAALPVEHTTIQLRLIGTSRDHSVAGAGRLAALPTTSPD